MIQRKTEREKEMKNYGADLYEDYEYSGKKYGIKCNPEEEILDTINKEFLESETFTGIEDLEYQLQMYKAKFLEFDKDPEGNINVMGLKKMLEELGQPKTHREVIKMIRQIDKTNKGTICYRDFVTMMCSPTASFLERILMFEQKAKGDQRPSGVAPKRDLSSLP